MMLQLPILRAGTPHYSLQKQPLIDIRNGEQLGEMSQALPGQIARDLRHAKANRQRLEELSVSQLIDICHRAGELMAEAELPLGDGTQGPEEYLSCLAATAGMPVAMGRQNLGKIVGFLGGIEKVLDGLTRGLDLSVLEDGYGLQDGRQLSYLRQSDTLGAILPNNSPGVHNLWIPAIPLRTPLVLKPGSAEPWTPYRIAAAFIAAGCPKEAFSLYPTHHGGVAEVLLRTGRSLFFGDAKTVKSWQGQGKVQLHGPGWSKIVLGPDTARRWPEYLDLMANSVTANGGRSCINASGVWTVEQGPQLAAALARQLATIEARPLDDPEAQLAAFPNPEVAKAISEMIDQQLHQPGAEDLTAKYRTGSRVAEAGGCTFLLPTVIYCTDPDHPLAAAEYGFPFVSVVEAPSDELLGRMGPSLIASIVSEDPEFLGQALTSPHIDRLNLGPIPTFRISWDQPHEGNLFDHLFQQRAFQLDRQAS